MDVVIGGNILINDQIRIRILWMLKNSRQTHGDPFLKKLAYQKLQRHDDSYVKNVDVTRQQFML